MVHEDACYAALLARDPRFDGKFFTGVKTTGIYCRPICPARPRRENVEFFPTAHAAEAAGYRPCLRCRPEAAPRSPAWAGRSALVQRALETLAHVGEDATASRGFREEAFAARFGVGARHLRRLFETELGKTPRRIHLENRLALARQLIAETALPMANIAFSAGFASVRRFNAAVRERFGRAPTRLRTLAGPARAARGEGIALRLPYRPPFDWDASLAYYRGHAIAGIETFEGGTYSRIYRFGARPGLIRLAPEPGAHRLRLEVVGGEVGDLGRLARAARRMFDLDSDPLLVAEAFARVPSLERLLRRSPGLRSPRGWDPWETAVSAVLGQLVSIPMANRLVGRLVEAFGETLAHPQTGAPARLFPRPETLALAPEGSLARIGTTSARAAALQELARRVAEGRLSLDSAQDPQAFRAALLAIKGIGPWTAEYVSLRALGDADAFPATDLVLRRALAEHPDADLNKLKPWRGYAAAHLWHAHATRPAPPERRALSSFRRTTSRRTP